MSFIMNKEGQYSLDLVIAIGVFIITATTAFYYMISAFTPHYSRFDIYASAYRVATILSEDAGLNLTNITYQGNNNYTALLETNWEENGTINSSVEDWYNAINYTYKVNTTIKRVGLSDYYRILKLDSSYERCIPNVLNATKVKNFFNKSWWNESYRFNWNDTRFGDYNERLDKFYRNLSILIGLNSSLYRFNISIRNLNGEVYEIDGVECQIGYPIPDSGEIAKFERLVVIDDIYSCLDNCMNSTSIKRLIVYVW